VSTELNPEFFILGALRSQQRLSPATVTAAILSTAANNSAFAKFLDSYRYTATRTRQQSLVSLDWQTTISTLVKTFQDEPRISLSIVNRKRKPDTVLRLFLNAEDELVSERIQGRKRKVPKASDSSSCNLRADAYLFQQESFTQAYIELVGASFDHLQGHYGWCRHISVRYDNDMDRVYGDRFMPRYITWCNLFGPALVEQLGRQRILNAPAHEVVELAGGGIMVLACANPLDELQPEVQERIAAIKQHLGILSPSERATPEERAAFEARTAQGQAKMKERIATAFREANEQTASEMVRLAEGCVRGVRHIWDLELDFSPASLQLVDEIIQHGFAAEEDEDTIEQAVVALGSYVGEVIRRWQGGKWRDVHFNGVPTLTAIGSQRRELNPFHLIRQRLKNRQQPASVSLQVTIETIVTAD
jgi:hypothetical protein